MISHNHNRNCNEIIVAENYVNSIVSDKKMLIVYTICNLYTANICLLTISNSGDDFFFEEISFFSSVDDDRCILLRTS